MEFRTPYGQYDPLDFVTAPGEEPSMTRQAFADECDVNKIVARAERTGVISHYNQAEPRFMDVSDMVDFQTAMNVVISTQDAFDALPSAVRFRFANDPAALVSFLADASNREEAISLGLINPAQDVVSKAPVEPLKQVSDSGDA